MKINCDVIRDLLPLYAENMLSEKSRQLVDEHLHDCENCKKTLAEMKKPEIQITHNIDPIKKFKHGFRKHTITVASLTAFITVAIIILIWGIFFLQPGDELGYTILCFYFFLPLTAFICSWILGTRPNKIKWLVPFIFGCIGGILPYAIYRSMDMIFVFFAFIPSIFGLLIGTIIYAIKARRRN